MTGHREAENAAKDLRDAFGGRVHDSIAIPLGDIDYFMRLNAYGYKASTNFLLDVIIKQTELVADLRQTVRSMEAFTHNIEAEPEQPTDHAPDVVSHPGHYKMHDKECIVEMLILFGLDNFITFCQMNAWKYRYRAGNKANNSADQDNAKADRYIEYAARAREIDYWNLSPTYLTDDEYWSKGR